MDGNRSQTQYDNAEIDKLIAQHGNNEWMDGWEGGACKSDKYLVVWATNIVSIRNNLKN